MPESKPEKPADDAPDFAFLGREFMTWLLFRSDQGEAEFETDGGEKFTLTFLSRVKVGGIAGEIADATLKGKGAAYSVEVRAAVGAGRTVREAEMMAVQGEREWRYTLLADTLDLKSVKLPALLTEEEDDRFLERITLLEELDAMIGVAFTEFLSTRIRQSWKRTVLPGMRDWLAAGLAVKHERRRP